MLAGVAYLRGWVRHLRGGLTAHTGPAPEAAIAQVDYDDYWRSRGVPEPTAPPADDLWDYPRFVAIELLLRPGERIADIGCGSGASMAFLRERGHSNVVGIDPSSFAVAALSAWGYDARCSSVEDLDPEQLGPIDVAIFADVLEHVVPFERVLAKVADHAGRVIICHPNIGYWPHRWRLLTGRFPLQWGWHPAEHVRFFTIVDLLEHLDRERYQIVSVQTPIGVPSLRLRARFPNLLASHIVLELRRP